MNRLSYGSIVAAIVASTAAQAGKIQSWIDEDGNKHFGDKPPRNVQSQPVKVRAAPYDPQAAAAAHKRTNDAQHRVNTRQTERAEQQAQQRTAASQRKKKQKQCAYWKDTLSDYLSAQYIYDPNPDGSRTILSDAEREAETQRMKEQIARNCR